MFRELPFSADCINKLYHTCRLRQYFLEGRLIAAERRWREMTQEELVDGIYENVENLSRVENGKANCDRIKFYSLMERLEMDKTRYDGNLVTDEYQVLELDQSIERHLAEGEYEEVGHELYQLEKSVDMSEKCNRQLVLGLKNREELRKKKNGTQEEIRKAKEEALERAKELLELTYHLENVEAEGQRYLDKSPARVVAPIKVKGGKSIRIERVEASLPITTSTQKSSIAGYKTSSTTLGKR